MYCFDKPCDKIQTCFHSLNVLQLNPFFLGEINYVLNLPKQGKKHKASSTLGCCALDDGLGSAYTIQEFQN